LRLELERLSTAAVFDHVTSYPTRSARLSPLSSSYMLRLQPIVVHPRCYMIDSSPITTKLPSSHHVDCPSSSLHAALVARSPSQAGHRFRSHRCWGGPLLYVGMINILFCMFPLLLLFSTSRSLFQNSLFYYGPFTISDTAPPTPSSSTHLQSCS